MPLAAQNTSGTVEIPLSVFGGENDELSAPDIPEGVSPSNGDMAYLPGSAFSREGLHKLFATPFPGNVTVVYEKSYLQANGQYLNLYLTSDGKLWKEDITNSPGIYSQFGQITPGAICVSTTIGGKEYFAFSNGIVGTDAPRVYDGTNFDRLSEDGVGAAPTAVTELSSQVACTSTALANLGGGIAAISEVGNLVTVTTNTPHGLTAVFGFVLIYGVTTAGYNGLYQIVSIPSTTTFTTLNAGAGLGADTTGNVGLGTVTVITGTAHGLQVGDAVVISGNAGTFNNGSNQTSNTPEPTFWDVVQVTNSTTFLFSVVGLRGQGNLNTTTIAGGAGGQVNIGGMIPQGTHQVCVSFLYRSGYISKPSPIASFTCTGNKQATVTGIPLGVTNLVTARIISLTGAGGGNFFYLLASSQIPGNSNLFNGGLAPATNIQATIIPDNTATSFVIDIPDTALFAGQGADIPGNDLFALKKLAPCIGIFSYGQRSMAYGEWNTEQQFLNMGFEGGVLTGAPTVPTGWTIGSAGGALVSSPSDFGLAWQITGDGSGNAIGLISQSAFQTQNGTPKTQPNTQYTLRLWAKVSAAGLSGRIQATLSSASTGFTATAKINLNTVTTTGTFVSNDFDMPTPATIPADFKFSIWETGLNNAATVAFDEMELVFTTQPQLSSQFAVSYTQNLESFDDLTGVMGPTADDTPIMEAGIIRQDMYIVTQQRLHRTSQNGAEPNTWAVDQVSDLCGAFSIRSLYQGEDYLTWAGPWGLRIFEGGQPYKISQEIQKRFDAINLNAQQYVWLVNDAIVRRFYIGVPSGSATGPNQVLMMDYRELDQASQISSSGSLRISFTGKMISSDLSRKWSAWTVNAASGAILIRQNNEPTFFMGSGNGQAPGQGTGFGNVYYLDPLKLTDDDYGSLVPFYFTYFFTNHESEASLGIGAKWKLYKGINLFITGVGNVTITPYANNLANPWPSTAAVPLQASLNTDLALALNVSAQRCAFKISVTPLEGHTDVQFNLQKLIVSLIEHSVFPGMSTI